MPGATDRYPIRKRRYRLTAEARKRKSGECVREQDIVEDFDDVHHVIAVMSCKGGVGRSLVVGLLAVALQREGYQVGILDADIAGPTIPKMFFSNGAGLRIRRTGPLPRQTATGIRIMSMSVLSEQERAATLWRGPLTSKAITQFWGDILWGELDYLVVDLPPGSSDAALRVMQALPISGIVLVTIPQALSSNVVCKATLMAREIGIPILGLVENMSYYPCPGTGEHQEKFGASHAQEIAERIGVPLLGCLPVDPSLAILCDSGCLEHYAEEGLATGVKDLVARTPAAKWRCLEPAPPASQGWQQAPAPESYGGSFAEQH
jgi:hydrogenase maturation protease